MSGKWENTDAKPARTKRTAHTAIANEGYGRRGRTNVQEFTNLFAFRRIFRFQLQVHCLRLQDDTVRDRLQTGEHAGVHMRVLLAAHSTCSCSLRLAISLFFCTARSGEACTRAILPISADSCLRSSSIAAWAFSRLDAASLAICKYVSITHKTSARKGDRYVRILSRGASAWRPRRPSGRHYASVPNHTHNRKRCNSKRCQHGSNLSPEFLRFGRAHNAGPRQCGCNLCGC